MEYIPLSPRNSRARRRSPQSSACALGCLCSRSRSVRPIVAPALADLAVGVASRTAVVTVVEEEDRWVEVLSAASLTFDLAGMANGLFFFCGPAMGLSGGMKCRYFSTG